jgi:hypothetical protein
LVVPPDSGWIVELLILFEKIFGCFC